MSQEKKTLDNEVDTTWRRKGHLHEGIEEECPDICPNCMGFGTLPNGKECARCGGTGEIYK